MFYSSAKKIGTYDAGRVTVGGGRVSERTEGHLIPLEEEGGRSRKAS